jgi:hypothetical protein
MCTQQTGVPRFAQLAIVFVPRPVGQPFDRRLLPSPLRNVNGRATDLGIGFGKATVVPGRRRLTRRLCGCGGYYKGHDERR